MTLLEVEFVGDDKLKISYPENHPRKDDIERMLQHLGPGYVEYVIRFGEDPHCSACRDSGCENVGHGDDACPGFKYGDLW